MRKMERNTENEVCLGFKSYKYCERSKWIHVFLFLFFFPKYNIWPFAFYYIDDIVWKRLLFSRSQTEVQMAVNPGFMKKEREGDNMSMCILHGKLSLRWLCVWNVLIMNSAIAWKANRAKEKQILGKLPWYNNFTELWHKCDFKKERME